MLTGAPKLPIPACDCSSALRVTLAYLTHLFMEVFFQTSDALERVDVETYTAVGGGGGEMVKNTCDYMLRPQRHRVSNRGGGHGARLAARYAGPS